MISEGGLDPIIIYFVLAPPPPPPPPPPNRILSSHACNPMTKSRTLAMIPLIVYYMYVSHT